MNATLAAIESQIAQGLSPGAQLYVWQDGTVLADAAVGEARPGVAMTAESLVPWMSGTKPIVAAAILQLVESGRLGLDDTVATHLPPFAAHGKEGITIRHLLTHTAGLRHAASHVTTSSYEQIIAQICNARPEPDWPPGQKAGYHVASSWYILGEIVRLIDGRPIERYVREMIFEPLGMNDSWLAMDAYLIGRYGERIAQLYKTGTSPIDPNPASASAEELARVRPGASGRGPAHDLGRFYQMMLGGGQLDGRRILQAETVAQMTARQRARMYDATFRQVVDWGLGVIVNSAHYGHLDTLPYNFGPGASHDAFGHGGAQSSISFADPVRRLVVVIVLNGTPGEPKHHARMKPILAALYEDLDQH